MLDIREKSPVIEDIKDRFDHIYILGKPRMGKSTLMEHMANYDISKGFSVIFLDPKGDSVKKLYYLNKDNPKVRYVSFDHPIVLNPLSRKNESLDVIISEFVQVLDILIKLTSPNPESSVRMTDILVNTIKGLNKKDINFDFLYKFLHSSKFRQQQTLRKEHQDWWDEIDDSRKSGYDKRAKFLTTASSISSRLSKFVHNEKMSHFIIGECEFDVSELTNNGETLLVNTKTRERDNLIFLSNLIIYAVISHIFSDKPRKPLLIYVDEFQLSASEIFADALRLGRSSQVGFTLAHQDFMAIDKEVLESIFGTVNGFVVFRCGDLEAKRFSTILEKPYKDILNKDRHKAYFKLGKDVSDVETYPSKVANNLFFFTNSVNRNININKLSRKHGFLNNKWIIIRT